jgi:hypothetical protein
VKATLEEYFVNGLQEEVVMDIKEFVHPKRMGELLKVPLVNTPNFTSNDSQLIVFIQHFIFIAMDQKSVEHRERFHELLLSLVSAGVLSTDAIQHGILSVLHEIDDIALDLPKVVCLQSAIISIVTAITYHIFQYQYFPVILAFLIEQNFVTLSILIVSEDNNFFYSQQ